MSELPPEQEENILPQAGEQAPRTYEAAFAAAEKLRALGIEDVYDSEDAEVIALLDTISAWEESCGLPMAGVESVEKARNIVRASLLFINAGFRDIKFYREAMERLSTEYSSAQQGNDPEILEILGSAIDELEGAIQSVNPNEKFERAISARLDEAVQKARSGDKKEVADAWRLLTSTLSHPEYKRYFSHPPGEDKKRLITNMRAAVSEVMKGDENALAKLDELLAKFSE